MVAKNPFGRSPLHATIDDRADGGWVRAGVARGSAARSDEVLAGRGIVASGGLGREVSWVLRAAALPGAEFVLPVIAHRRLAAAASSVGRFLQTHL